MTSVVPPPEPSLGRRIGIGAIEVFLVAPAQALEWGVMWGGAISVGLFLNGYTLLWLLEHFGIL